MTDLQELRAFVAAARHLHFRAAARSIALSPAAFSDSIRRLEESLGAVLFERTTRSIRLTPAGERLLPQALACLREAERCQWVVQQDALVPPYSITLGTRYELGLSWLLPALSALEKLRPERTVHLCFADTQDLMQKLRRGAIDAMVTSARLHACRLVLMPLQEEHYVFVAHPRLLRSQSLRRVEDAAAHRLLDISDDLPLFSYFRDARPSSEVWRFASTQYLGTIGAVKARVLEAAGVAVLPHYFVEAELRRRRLRVLFPEVRLPTDWFRLCWLDGHARDAELSVLAGQLAEVPLR